MEAYLCDCCKKVISRDEVKRIGLEFRRIEVCEECEVKVNEVKQNYEKQYNELEEKANELRKKFKSKLDELGLKE